MTNTKSDLFDALGEWKEFRRGVPGARTASGDLLAEAAQALLDACDAAVERAWDEGHAATDEHGPGECACPNPYRSQWADDFLDGKVYQPNELSPARR